MSMSKVVSPRQASLNQSLDNWNEINGEEIKVKKPQLSSRPVKKLADDVCTDIGKLRLGSVNDISDEESQSVIVEVSEKFDSSDSSESAGISGKETVAAKFVETKTQNINDEIAHSVDIYCSEPKIKTRCTLGLITTSATTALGVLLVMTTKGDDSIANKAAWIAASALGGVTISSIAGLFHFVCSLHPKPMAAVTQPA